MNRFQDRKLNKCAVCQTRKLLAMHFDANGRMFFLCQGHTLLLESLEEEMGKLPQKR